MKSNETAQTKKSILQEFGKTHDKMALAMLKKSEHAIKEAMKAHSKAIASNKSNYSR